MNRSLSRGSTLAEGTSARRAPTPAGLNIHIKSCSSTGTAKQRRRSSRHKGVSFYNDATTCRAVDAAKPKRLSSSYDASSAQSKSRGQRATKQSSVHFHIAPIDDDDHSTRTQLKRRSSLPTTHKTSSSRPTLADCSYGSSLPNICEGNDGRQANSRLGGRKEDKRAFQSPPSPTSSSGRHSPPQRVDAKALVTSAMRSRDVTRVDTFLPHLDVGAVPGPHDMVHAQTDPRQVDMLQVLDFAFIQRSGGRFTYAMVAGKSDDGISFVVDADGSTKEVSRKRWADCIRLANPEGRQQQTVPCGGTAAQRSKSVCTTASGRTILSLFD